MEILFFGACAVCATAFAAGFMRGFRSEDGLGRAWSMGTAWLIFSVIITVPLCIVVIVVVFWSGTKQMRDSRLQARADLREEFPMESLADRLNYETVDDSTTLSPVILEDHELNGEVENRLVKFEERSDLGYRYHALERLHDRKTDEFLENAGFGIIRMRGVNRGETHGKSKKYRKCRQDIALRHDLWSDGLGWARV